MADIVNNMVFRAKFEGAEVVKKGLEKTISDYRGRLKEAGVDVKELNTSINSNTGAVTVAARTQKRFRFELLSTMFAGMALTQVLDGQIKKTRDLIGATKLHEAAMTAAYIPAQLQLADMTRWIDEMLLSLGENEKAWFGWSATILNWGGQALMTLSQIGLAWQGLEKLGLTPNLGRITGAFGKIGGGVRGALGGMGTRGGAGLFTGRSMEKAFGKFSKKFVGLFKGMGKSLTSLGEFGSFSIASTLWEKIQSFGAAIAGALGWAVGKITTLFGSFNIGDKLTAIVSGISGFFKKIGDKILSSKVGTWFSTAWGVVKTAASGFFNWIRENINLSKITSWFSTAFQVVFEAAEGFFNWIRTKIEGSQVLRWFSTAFQVVLEGAEGFFNWIKTKITDNQASRWFTGLFAPVKGALQGMAGKIATGLLAVGAAAEAILDAKSLMEGPNEEGLYTGGGLGTEVGNIGNQLGGGTFYNPLTGQITQAGAVARMALPPGTIQIGGYTDYAQIQGNSSNFVAALLGSVSRNAAQKFIAEYFNDIGWGSAYARQVVEAGGFDEWVKNFRSGYSGPFEFANGGIVNSPTNAIIGEAGPEAVIPLDKFGDSLGMTVNINIDAKVASEFDLRDLAQRISDIIAINQRSSLAI